VSSIERSANSLRANALQSILDQLSLAIFVFRGQRLIYANPRGTRLIHRLRTTYQIELVVMLVDHLAQSGERPQQTAATVTLTGHDNEPFVVHLMALPGRRGDIAVSIREIGSDMSVFKNRYRLSKREIQVIELVLRGYNNGHIAKTLGITPATTKKHLSRVFAIVAVDSRAQLTSKLA
jgi:DNA-binding CsgD family transcriptional regulator